MVVVLFTFCVGEDADPGIWTETCTRPTLVRSEAGTGAVSWLLLTKSVVRGTPFHRISAPVVKPDPLAVIVKLCPPAYAVLGLRKDSTEVEVWMERFVL